MPKRVCSGCREDIEDNMYPFTCHKPCPAVYCLPCADKQIEVYGAEEAEGDMHDEGHLKACWRCDAELVHDRRKKRTWRIANEVKDFVEGLKSDYVKDRMDSVMREIKIAQDKDVYNKHPERVCIHAGHENSKPYENDGTDNDEEDGEIKEKDNGKEKPAKRQKTKESKRKASFAQKEDAADD